MAQITGRVWLSLDGKLLRSQRGATLNFGGITREAVTGNEVYGYTEKIEAPTIECTLLDTKDLSLVELQQTTDATVRFETDTGKVYVLQEAFVTDALQLSGDGGEVRCNFAGTRAEELTG